MALAELHLTLVIGHGWGRTQHIRRIDCFRREVKTIGAMMPSATAEDKNTRGLPHIPWARLQLI
jgi:hypothetical protein